MNYIDEKEFQKAIEKYKKDKSNEQQLLTMFLKLIKGVIYGTSIKYFKKHTALELEDLIQEAILKCFKELERFDPRRGRAFAFFSVIVKYALIAYINKNLYFAEISPKNLETYHIFIKSSTEKDIFNFIEYIQYRLNTELKKILPQYKYNKYYRLLEQINKIIAKGYYTKQDLLFIKNKILPVLGELDALQNKIT